MFSKESLQESFRIFEKIIDSLKGNEDSFGRIAESSHESDENVKKLWKNP